VSAAGARAVATALVPLLAATVVAVLAAGIVVTATAGAAGPSELGPGSGAKAAPAADTRSRQTAATARTARAADAPRPLRRAVAGAPRAPSSPPLTSAGSTPGTGADGEVGVSAHAEADPLVGNGLASPLCQGALGRGELPQASRRDCETSGFVAAGSPTSNYGLDVHIDTGVLGISVWSAVQDLLIAPLWMALVWAVHALVVMLEWCFTIDLLDSPSVSAGVGAGLRHAQAAFTEPWLPLVLALASVLALYNGLIRRRVAETMGQAVLMLAMMVGGLWVMLDPQGTVGAVGGWANQASLGTLAASARGAPAGAGRVLADSMAMVFAETVEAPWCYMEFGAVGWCRSPARLSPQLHAAAIRIAADELARVSCKPSAESVSACVAAGGAEARALEHSAELLRDARSNGAIFLALPANGPARNSINEQGSLLAVMCQSSEATNCHGAMAAQAEFRTSGLTGARIGGLLLIVAGALGMLLLLGFIAVRLLAAALFSLLYLLLAPAAVLAPALGDGGRAVFRKWAAHLLGALVSKLLFSFLLGVVLAIIAILADLEALGWWTQWLLMSTFWWGAFARRHRALAVAAGAIGRESATRPPTIGHRVAAALGRQAALGSARSLGQRFSRQDTSSGGELARAGYQRAQTAAREQVERSLERDLGEASARVGASPEAQARLSARRAQLARIQSERGNALAGGEVRHAHELGHRAQRVEEQIDREQAQLNEARHTSHEAERSVQTTGSPYGRAEVEQRARFLDQQAALPASSRARTRASGERRDYVALAGLAGYSREEYGRLDPRAQRAARREVDRELALRKELSATANDLADVASVSSLRRSQQRKADRNFDSTLAQRIRDGGHGLPASRRERSPIDEWRGQRPIATGVTGGGDSTVVGGRESTVMQDAREVARRRKRQLGRDRS
jgi:hypothetical protein